MKFWRVLVIVPYFVLATLPLGWLALTSIKTYDETISARAKFVPWIESARPADSVRFTATVDAYKDLSKPVAGTPHDFYHYLGNSIVISVLSSVAA